MAKIFLSYRRQDSAGVAGRIYDRLRAHFGPDSVFIDVDSVPFGVDFQEHIESVLSQCDVFLAVIGPDWAGQINTGRRIDDPRDWVRIEVEAVLKRGLPVIPVLIDHIRMPTEADLPPSLARLAYRNAIDVDQGRDFHVHVDRLIRGIELLSASDLVQGPKAKPQGADSSKSKAVPMPADVIAAEHVPRRVPAAPRQQEPTVWSLLRGALPKRRWFYLAALLLLALLGIILTLKPKGVPIPSTTTWDGPKSFTPPQEPQPPQPKRDLTNSIGMRLVRIEPGTFLMGSPDTDKDAFDDEKPQHRVRITRPFYLGVHEVTRGQFRRFVDDTGYQTEAEKDGKGGWGWNEDAKKFEQNPKYTWLNPGFEQTDEHPVVNVSWNDAVAFAEWLSRKEGVTYRLPTEAEWEYACRAGTTTKYCSGDDPEGLAAVANIADGTAKTKYPDWSTIAAQDGFIYTAPVGRYNPNAWGLFDMHGNVWEWCSDGYAADYYKRSPVDDPPGPDGASDRVIRGGGWGYEPRRARSAYRGRFAPGYRSYNLGFRLARVQSVR